MNHYCAWKTDSSHIPIEGSERYLSGRSKMAVLQHIAYEYGIIEELPYKCTILKLPNGERWYITFLRKDA